MRKLHKLTSMLLGIALSVSVIAQDQQQEMEEIVVTARQQVESMQDVPVTISALSEEDLNRYNISTITEASKMIPNFQVYQGTSGNSSNLYLRGIGSNSIEAAFDQSVAVNLDGVVINIGRVIFDSYLDMEQIEVLKGPQSLYFGKSATAGVVSVTTKDPGDQFEATAMLGYESEHDQTYLEAVLSGPITETFGARLAIGSTESDELFKNLFPGVKNEYRGEESKNARLTLVWEANDELRIRLKASRAEYENDGSNGRSEEICPEGSVQPTVAPSTTFVINGLPGVDDCKLNGNTSVNDLHPSLPGGLPYGFDDGVAAGEQSTNNYTVQVDWNASDSLLLTSVTAYIDLEQKELDTYDSSAGLFGGMHRNVYESFSQELRLASNYDGAWNFLVGLYYQDVTQEFEAYQYAFNFGFLFGPDPITGNEYDWNKNHFLDSEVRSAFIAGYWDLSESIEVTAGVRYTDETKDGYITIPYLHAFAPAFGFNAPPLVEGLEFDDDNISPEVAVNWYVTDDISVFAAYKEGFKSGGVGNSALPSSSLNANNPGFPEFLLYDSEEASGFEVGMKSQILGGSMRLNATAYHYVYEDLQVSLFDSAIINFQTYNASELTTEGFEVDMLWLTPMEGLTVRGALSINDTEYTDDFLNATGENLKGEPALHAADVAGTVGITYDWSISENWRMNLSADSRYSDDYPLSPTLDPYMQDSFWIFDAAIKLYSADDRYELALIGRNLGDEIYARSAGSRPGACANADLSLIGVNPAGVCQSTGPNSLDQTASTSLGKQYTVQFRIRF